MDDQRFAFFSKAILYAVKRIVAHVAYSCEISRAGATTEGREWNLSLVAAFLLKFLQPMLCPKRLSGCRLRAHKVFRQQSTRNGSGANRFTGFFVLCEACDTPVFMRV